VDDLLAHVDGRPVEAASAFSTVTTARLDTRAVPTRGGEQDLLTGRVIAPMLGAAPQEPPLAIVGCRAMAPRDQPGRRRLAVRTISRMLADWINMLGAGVDRRPGRRVPACARRAATTTSSCATPTSTCRLSVKADAAVTRSPRSAPGRGQRVLVPRRARLLGRPRLAVHAAPARIRPVGIGALLAELERLQATARRRGLFAPERRKRLPFIPTRIGLICGRASAAMEDVLANARERWPSIAFEIREVPGPGTAGGPSGDRGALPELDAMPAVDVIIVTRGGGSVEDLLPFSNETLVRAVAACRTPVVSAIGHEQDAPLLDFVADLRASTPTDAAKRVVPSLREQVDTRSPACADAVAWSCATSSTASSRRSTTAATRRALGRSLGPARRPPPATSSTSPPGVRAPLPPPPSTAATRSSPTPDGAIVRDADSCRRRRPPRRPRGPGPTDAPHRIRD